jgi:hypothetical protein
MSLNIDFKQVRHFFKDLRSKGKVEKDNKVTVYYLTPSHKIVKKEGEYLPDKDCISVFGLKLIYLANKGMYHDDKGPAVMASYNSAMSIRHEKEKQDYLTGEQTEALLCSGLLTNILRPNITLGVIGFVMGICVTLAFVTTVLGVSLL